MGVSESSGPVAYATAKLGPPAASGQDSFQHSHGFPAPAPAAHMCSARGFLLLAPHFPRERWCQQKYRGAPFPGTTLHQWGGGSWWMMPSPSVFHWGDAEVCCTWFLGVPLVLQAPTAVTSPMHKLLAFPLPYLPLPLNSPARGHWLNKRLAHKSVSGLLLWRDSNWGTVSEGHIQIIFGP